MKQKFYSTNYRLRVFFGIIAAFIIASAITIGYQVMKNRSNADSPRSSSAGQTSDLLQLNLPPGI